MSSKKKSQKNINYSNTIALLAVLAALGLVLAYTFIVRPMREKATFEKLDKQAYDYIQKINAKYPGKVTHEKHCHYSSAKFSKGTLGCGIDTTLVIKPLGADKETSLMKYADTLQKKLGWKFSFADTSNSIYGSETNIKRTIYDNGGITCGVHYDHGLLATSPTVQLDFDEIRINIGCSGNARKSYYPIR